MSRKRLPAIDAPKTTLALAFEPIADVVERWNPLLRAARAQAGTVIDIYDVIGVDFWTGGGVTAKSITAGLKGAGDVTVNINSPGGDFFEGLAIYNILRAHDGRVDVNIMGMAASAASIIAMAGDAINIGKAASLMIHNAWGLVIGNANDMEKAAEDFAGFDAIMTGLYADRTGLAPADIAAMMDAETWLNGEDAVAKKFADALLPADQVKEQAASAAEAAPKLALRRVDAMLAQAGLPRSERRALIKEIRSGTPGAAASPEITPRADLTPLHASLQRLDAALSR